MGKAGAGRVDFSSGYYEREDIPGSGQKRQSLGLRDLRERRLVLSTTALQASRAGAHRAARPAPDMCKAVPLKWWSVELDTGT